jgi:hypothetical protein|tara:strand:- start:363 stop:491 length:129 start_codon:yes stop_codon:yes gene_type:complete
MREKKSFLKNEMSKLKLTMFLSGITYGELEDMKEGNKEFKLS